MNSFRDGQQIELQGRRLIEPWLHRVCNGNGGRYVFFDSGETAKELQLAGFGDAVAKFRSDGRNWNLEFKCEREQTGNLFLETWSDKNRRKGWLFTSFADLLLYQFLDTRMGYVIDMRSLQDWAYGTPGSYQKLLAFGERPQSRYDQRNETWGCPVPITTIQREVGCHSLYFDDNCDWTPTEPNDAFLYREIH